MITFPRLPAAVSSSLTESLLKGESIDPAWEHVGQTYAPVGERARPADVRAVRDAVLTIARAFGFPQSIRGAVAFDREAAVALRDVMTVSGAEAGNRDMWTWIAYVLLPDVTAWRWAAREKVNVERWVARDLTRHTWARLWWQAKTFEGHEEAFALLQESELNQLFERREIGGRGALTVYLARELQRSASMSELPRREIFRDVNKRLLRVMAFTDTESMSDSELSTFVRRQTEASVQALAAERSR